MRLRILIASEQWGGPALIPGVVGGGGGGGGGWGGGGGGGGAHHSVPIHDISQIMYDDNMPIVSSQRTSAGLYTVDDGIRSPDQY